MNEEECISWLEKEITKENVRVNSGETKTGIRRWVLSIMKNMVLSNSNLKNEILNEVRIKCNKRMEEKFINLCESSD